MHTHSTSSQGALSSWLIEFDEKSDSIPFWSTVTNIVNLFQKIVVLPLLSIISRDFIENNHYFSYINEKKFIKCFLLTFPFLGNFIYKKNNRQDPAIKEHLEETQALGIIKNTHPTSLTDAIKKCGGLHYESVALAAIEKTGSTYITDLVKYLSDDLKKNKNVGLALINKVSQGYVLGIVKSLGEIADEQIALEAIQKVNSVDLEDLVKYLSDDLKKNKNVGLALINKVSQGYVLGIVKSLGEIADEQIALEAIKKVNSIYLENLIKYISPRVKAIDKIALKIEEKRKESNRSENQKSEASQFDNSFTQPQSPFNNTFNEQSYPNNPKDLPDYFDELRGGGYLHLYDHLIEMRKLSARNDRPAAIEKESFSLLSHVVIETREAIIRKIESSIPHHCPNILFLLGGSGAGKSTTFCFLRGDEMILNDCHYESRKDKNSLIGHEQATSCTFLPTVELIKDYWLIVDFPGFDDSNGPLISLGMECALKALIRKHQPKVLIIESITNTEGRFAAAAQLGSRLKRLLDKKEECVLGITKYSKDPDFRKIRAIEEQQKRERSLPTPEENQLTTEINVLASLNQESLQPMIQQKQQQLEEKQKEKARQQQLPLPENDEKIESRKNLQESENELLKQIELTKIIRFDDLQNSACLPSYFADLSQGKALNANPEDPLDPDHEKLIDHLFVNDLLDEMKKVKYGDFKFENFEQSVKETSLINTLFSQSHPEIGTFLHLPEIDPRIARNYDKKIVGECIDKYMRSVILNLDISLINTALKELKEVADPMEISELKTKFTKLSKYVMGLLGVALSGNENTEEIEAKWIETRKDIAADALAVEKEYTLPDWTNVLITVPLEIPKAIHTLVKWNALEQVEKETFKKIITDCSRDLNQMYDMLIKLYELQSLIKNKR